MRASSRSIWMVLLVVCAGWPCRAFAEEKDSLPTILLKKGTPKSITQAVIAPSPDKIDFTTMPLNCHAGFNNTVKYSYSDGCNMDLVWVAGNTFCTRRERGRGSNSVSAYENTNISISIRGEKISFTGALTPIDYDDGCAVTNTQLTGGASGYLLNFTMWSLEDLQCDVQLNFPADYDFYIEPEATTVKPSQISGVNESGIGTMQIVFISVGAAVVLGLLVSVLCLVLWCRKKRYCKKKRSPLPRPSPVSSLPPPVSSPPLMLVSCISSTEKPAKTAMPVSIKKSEGLATASKQLTEVTDEVETVDPHEGAPQPRRLTDAEFQAKAKEYMRRVREKEAREEAEAAAGDTEAETAITEKTLDPTQKSLDAKKTVDAAQKSIDAKKTVDVTQKSIDTKKTVDVTQKTQEANKPGVGKR